jgi:hypothetical protein
MREEDSRTTDKPREMISCNDNKDDSRDDKDDMDDRDDRGERCISLT